MIEITNTEDGKIQVSGWVDLEVPENKGLMYIKAFARWTAETQEEAMQLFTEWSERTRKDFDYCSYWK
jgi:hypothetical protein